MIAVLVNIIILLIVMGLLYWLVTLLPLPAPFPTIIQVAFVIIAILIVLSMFAGWVPPIGVGHTVLLR